MPRGGCVCVEREKPRDKAFFFLKKKQNVAQQQIQGNGQQTQQPIYDNCQALNRSEEVLHILCWNFLHFHTEDRQCGRETSLSLIGRADIKNIICIFQIQS